MIIFIFIVIGAILVFINISLDKKGKLKEKEKLGYNQKYIEENNIPVNASLLCCTSIIVNETVLTDGIWYVFAWKDSSILNFCGKKDCNDIRKIEIPIEDIQFYTRNVEIKAETIMVRFGRNISNGFVGASVGVFVGLLIGNLIEDLIGIYRMNVLHIVGFRDRFHIYLIGMVGATIGFFIGVLLGRRKRVNKRNKIDNRKTYLNYIENNENKCMVFTSKDYDALLKLIPEKEMNYIENNNILKSDKYKNDNSCIYKDIEELAKLRDRGILTEDEFNNKKQLLLEKIQ